MGHWDRPRIGVTGPDTGGAAAWFFAAVSVMLAGGVPIRIQPSRPRFVNKLDGLIVGGGSDVDPDTYSQEGFLNEYLKQTIENPRRTKWDRLMSFFRWLYYPLLWFIRWLFSKKGFQLDKARDRLEFRLVHQAVGKGIPILGICRGAQLLNVYFNGTLYQDIGNFYQEEPNPVSVLPVKKVTLKPGSRLADVFGTDRLWVNALHHQAVKSPGKGIRIVAQEENGVVQAIESIQRPFIVGVQWHPEYLIQVKRQRRLFAALVEAAGNKQAIPHPGEVKTPQTF